MLSNTNHSVEFLKDCSAIVIDTVADLSELNRGRRERIRMGRGQAPEESDDCRDKGAHTLH